MYASNSNISESLFELACQKLRSCRETIERNVTLAVNALGEVIHTFFSAFRFSGKERGPGSYGGDL